MFCRKVDSEMYNNQLSMTWKQFPKTCINAQTNNTTNDQIVSRIAQKGVEL